MQNAPNQDFYQSMSKTLLFLITFFSLQIVIFAERLPVRIFTSADGLGSSFVDTMMRDSRGFLWFCTRDGLSRFDGTQFITYQVGAENTSPGVENISETSNGTYWIVTTGGLYRFKNDVLSNPESAGSNRPILKAEFISPLRGKVYEDKSRQLWLINNKAFRIKETSEGKVDFTEESLNLPKISDQPFNIFKLRETDDGSLWIGTNIGFLRRLPDGRAVFYRFNRSLRDSVVNLLVAKDGNIWISLLEQLVIINPASIEEMKNFGALTVVNLETVPTKRLDDAVLVLPQKPNEIFNYSSDAFLNLFSGIDIFQTSNGSIWLTTGKELMVYNGKRVTRFGSSKGLVDSRKMLEDSEGNLWIGGSNGLMRLDLDGLFTYDMDDGLKSLYTRTIQQGSDGKIYTSQGDYSLGQFDGEKFHTISLNLPADSKALWASRNAWQDKKGEWWILSENGLYHFPAISDFQQLENRTPIAVYDKKRGLKGDRVFQIFEDSHSDIWIATDSEKEEEKGLSLWSRQTQEITTISDKNGYPRDKQVASFAEDTDGSLWIGFYEGGVARFRDGHFTEFGESFGVPSGMISDLLIDPNGRLWIASTRGGLLRVNNPKDETPQFSVITIANGLASNNIRTLIQELNGNLYLGTVRGVDRLSP
ncbi:MAG TPA: two-component regulator propeller domain-containing protein, partial [Pyrinomonadaceae bacterium]|nr:two-component regulator propeller domain-containing protein [Pyrinomonadaceae bacterium]